MLGLLLGAALHGCGEDPLADLQEPELDTYDASVVIDDVRVDDELDAAQRDASPAVDADAQPTDTVAMDAALADAATPVDGAPVDAAVDDAGKVDAGTALDAGAALDAGTDASIVLDAGIDGGQLDGATPADAGPKDAASPYDAAFVEAGTPGATTFTRVYAILGSRCRSCHTPGAPSDLNWTTKQRAYETLVRGAPDYQLSTFAICAEGGHKRVIPYQPEASLLYTKLARTQPCGLPMPLTTSFEPELLPEIRSWIMDGALNN